MLGAIMQNPLREPRVTCEVCTGPVDGRYLRCYRCNQDAALSGVPVARRVVPLTYTRVGEQADNDMYRYKDRRMSFQQRHESSSYQRLLVLLAGFVTAHSACLEHVATLPVTRMTTVASLSGRQGSHPLTDLATILPKQWERVGLAPADVPEEERRKTRSNHFSVLDSPAVVGQHVVVFDDTWVSGGHAQSAAATVRCAGAAEVSIVVLARRIDSKFRPKQLEHALTRMFEPREYNLDICPVTGGNCPMV
jgi:hypothetical protein